MVISDIAIRRFVFATMLTVAMILFGLVGLSRLGVSLYPDVEFPMVSVNTIWRGASPEEVETEITDVLENELGAVSGLKHISSQSTESNSQITLEFEIGVDVDVASQDVRDKVALVTNRLPDEAETPIISKLDINEMPIMWIAVHGERSIQDITHYADKILKPKIQTLPGVGSVMIGGARERQMRIWLDPRKMEGLNITPSEVVSALKEQNIELPGGKLETEVRDITVRAKGRLKTTEEFNQLVVAHRGARSITIGDIGFAEDGLEDSRSSAHFRMLTAVGMGVAVRSGANEVKVADAVKKLLEEEKKIIPSGTDLQVAFDQTEFTREAIREVEQALILGAIFTVICVFVFLQNIRATIITSLAIPSSIIGAFAIMYTFGFTVNNLTALGLTIVVGVVIDDAIIVLENIYRHREMGKSALDASFDGAKEITFAAAAATFSLMAVFIPVAFTRGLIGQFFYEFGITVAASIFLSLVVALTLTPMLCSRWLESDGTKDKKRIKSLEAGFEKLKFYYEKLLDAALAHRKKTIAVAAALFLVALFLIAFLGFELESKSDESMFILRIETPLDYSLENTARVLYEVEKILIKRPEIRGFFTVAGFGGGGFGSANTGIGFVTMVKPSERRLGQNEVMLQLREEFKKIPDAFIIVSRTSMLRGYGRSADIQFVVQGANLDRLKEYSREIQENLRAKKGFVEIDQDYKEGKPEISIHIDRKKSADLNVPVREIAQALNIFVGGADAGTFLADGETYDVRVRLQPQFRQSADILKNLFVRARDGKLVKLANLIYLEHGAGPTAIYRYDRQRAIAIYANLEGKLQGEAQGELAQIAKKILPDGYIGKFAGGGELFYETMYGLLFALFFAVVISYMVLASQFNSFGQPFIILVSLPLSLVGVSSFLFITRTTVNLYSMIGLILLVGLVTKNAILLLDYTNRLRTKEGLDAETALRRACLARFRPILMTAFSTLAGILPVALGLGAGSETRRPMAIAIFGGMLTSTLLTLVVIPAVYLMAESALERLKKRRLRQQ